MKVIHCLFLSLLTSGTFTAVTQAQIPARDLSLAALAWNSRRGEAAKSTVHPVQHPGLDGQGIRFDTRLLQKCIARLIALSQLGRRGDRLFLEAHSRTYTEEIKRSVSNPQPGKRFPRTLRRPERRKAAGHLPAAGALCSPYATKAVPFAQVAPTSGGRSSATDRNCLLSKSPWPPPRKLFSPTPQRAKDGHPAPACHTPTFPGRPMRPCVKAATPP